MCSPPQETIRDVRKGEEIQVDYDFREDGDELEALPACMSVQGGRVKLRPNVNREMYPFFEASYRIVWEMD